MSETTPSPNHPTMRGWKVGDPPINGSPRPHLRHTGRGYCPKCATTCLLLDDFELYGADMYSAADESDWDGETE